MSYIVEVAEDGSLTIPAEALENAEPHTRYTVEKNNRGLSLHPAPAKEAEKPKMTPEEWLAGWKDLSEKVSDSIKTDKSLVDILSEMRR